MSDCFFLLETIFFVMYIFAFVLFYKTNTEIVGWFLLFFTQLISSIYAATIIWTNAENVISFVLLIGFSFLLVSTFFVFLCLLKIRKTQQYKSSSSKTKIAGEIRQRLDRMRPFFVADVVFLFVLLFALEMSNRDPKNIKLFPLYLDFGNKTPEGFIKNIKTTNYGIVKSVQLKDNANLIYWIIPYATTAISFASLGVSSFLLYCSNSLYFSVANSSVK